MNHDEQNRILGVAGGAFAFLPSQTSAPKAPIAPLPAALGMLGKELSELEEAIDALAAQLGPLLRPEAPAPEGAPPAQGQMPAQAQLVEDVDCQRRRVERHIRLLDQLRNRLAV